VTKRIARLAAVSAALVAFALPASPASAQLCPIQEPTIGLVVCL